MSEAVKYKVVEASLLPSDFPDTWHEPLVTVVKFDTIDALRAENARLKKEVADNQTWHVQKLKGWRDTVTLALQRPGGARFEDVPGHIKALVKEHDTLRQLVAQLPVVDGQEVSVWLSPDESGWFVSKRPAFQAGLYWAKFRTQAEADSFRSLLAYRATLAAQDAREGEQHG